MNDFTTDLEWSHEQSDQPWWEEVYRKAFPAFQGMQEVKADGWAQRGGIDRLVLLRDGTVIKIDEKARRKVWPDFALEYWSKKEQKVPGWIAKDLNCDFIAYAFVPNQTCYLLPFQLLRQAWKVNRHGWCAAYPSKAAVNRGYTTVSVMVPIDVVLQAIARAMVITWSAPKQMEPKPYLRAVS